jgi:hypothetical protein
MAYSTKEYTDYQQYQYRDGHNVDDLFDWPGHGQQGNQIPNQPPNNQQDNEMYQHINHVDSSCDSKILP